MTLFLERSTNNNKEKLSHANFEVRSNLNTVCAHTPKYCITFCVKLTNQHMHAAVHCIYLQINKIQILFVQRILEKAFHQKH